MVAPAYSGLVRDMLAGSCPAVVNPNAFLRKVAKHDARWGDGRQQDSQEFLNSLLEVLQVGGVAQRDSRTPGGGAAGGARR